MLINRFVPIALTVIMLIAIHIIKIEYGLFYTLAPTFPMVVMSVYYGSMITGIISMLMVSGYAIYIIPDPIRVMLIIASLILTVIPVGILEWQRRNTDTIQNLIMKLREIHSLTLATMINWADWDDGEKWAVTENVHNKVSDLLAMVRKWHLLAKERGGEHG